MAHFLKTFGKNLLISLIGAGFALVFFVLMWYVAPTLLIDMVTSSWGVITSALVAVAVFAAFMSWHDIQFDKDDK